MVKNDNEKCIDYWGLQCSDQVGTELDICWMKTVRNMDLRWNIREECWILCSLMKVTDLTNKNYIKA